MRALTLAAGLVAMILLLGACGRAGDPELPPSATSSAATPGGPQKVQDRPFILDALIK